MTFVDILKNILSGENLTTTENGDLAYRHTVSANLDFFASAAAMRSNPLQAAGMFEKAWREDPQTAVMNLLFLRDIDNGLGERELFRVCFRQLCEKDRRAAGKMLEYIARYGRYDDLFAAYGTPVQQEMAAYTARQLLADLEAAERGENVSLLAKWMPSVNASSKKTRELAFFFMDQFGLNAASYRKMLSYLRKGRILEDQLRRRDYTFEYQHVPSVAMHKYRAAFERNDRERYEAYLNAVSRGRTFVNASAIFPYQIISEYIPGMNLTEQQAMQVKWDEMKRAYRSDSQTIVVRDGSASMLYPKTAMLNATALAVLYAELLKGEFAGKFITFSSKPELIELDEKMNLYEKLNQVYGHRDISNTDIAKVYDLIFQASRKVQNPRDYIRRVVVISDMQFDKGTNNIPTYETMKRKFEREGIPVPQMVWWNVNASRVQFAASPDDTNVRYIAGSSPHLSTALLKDRSLSPQQFMTDTLRPYRHDAKKITAR